MNDKVDIAALFSLESASDSLPEVNPAYTLSSLRFLENVLRGKSETLKAFIMTNGWPSAERFSEEVEEEAFMIAQQADYDPAFQRRCHKLMLALAEEGKIRLGYLAFLTDRILCNDGKHQRFGTQIREVTNGCFVPKPIEDPDRVDTLRTAVGLTESLAEYFTRVNTGDVVLHPVMQKESADEESKVIAFPRPH